MGLSDRSSEVSISPAKRFWTPGRIVLTVMAVGLLTVLGGSSCQSSDESNTTTEKRPASAPPPPPGNPPATAKAFVTLPAQLRETSVETLDGGSLKLSDYSNKVVVVNIWATWCGPCRIEMPDLVKLNKEYRGRGLVVLGVATKYNEANDPERVRAFARSQNVDYKILWDDGSFVGPLVAAVHGQSVIPQSFVISRDGRILKHFQGFSQNSTPMLMREAVEQALSDKG